MSEIRCGMGRGWGGLVFLDKLLNKYPPFVLDDILSLFVLDDSQ